MRNFVGCLILCVLFAAPSTRDARGQGTQTDWSGGPGVAGPVLEFGTRFDAGDLAWRSVPEQLALCSVPRADFPRTVLLADAGRPPRLAVADVTGDGFADIILTDPLFSPFDPRGGVYVWQNDGLGNWTRTIVTEDFLGARHVDTVDLDGDGDLDVIACAFYGLIDPPPPPPSERNGRFAWFENLDGVGGAWEKREIGELFWGANHVAAGDVDGDGDLDLIGCSTLTDGIYEEDTDVVWFENEDGAGETWTQHDVSADFDSAFEVYPADLDGDTDVDLIVSGYDRFEWFESLDGSGDAWSRHVIMPTLSGAGYLDVGDLDDDGDIDFVGSGLNNSVLVAWINDGTALSWDVFLVGPFARGYNVELADLDGDGDLDAVSSRESGATMGQLFWAENLGHGVDWNLFQVDTFAPRKPWAKAGDVNRDGKPELVASFEDSYDVGIQLATYALTDFVSNGTLASSILDGGPSQDWGAITWEAAIATGTALTVEIRGSQDAQNLGPFVTVPSSGTELGAVLDPSVRYVQYRISLESGSPDVSPVLREIGIEMGGSAGVDDPLVIAPRLVSLVRPNPTPGRAVLAYTLPSAGRVSLDIFDVSGRSILHRDRGNEVAGQHELAWDGRDDRGIQVPNGVYFLRLRTGAGESVQRLIRAR